MIVYASGRRGGYRRAGSDPRVAPPSQDGAGSPRGSKLNPPSDGIPATAGNKKSDETTYHFLLQRICCSPKSFVTKSPWRPWRTKHKMHRRMQFRSKTLRIEHTSSLSLERTHQPSPALALLHLAGGLLRRRRLLRAGGPSRRRHPSHTPAAPRAADVLLMRRRPYAPPTRD